MLTSLITMVALDNFFGIGDINAMTKTQRNPLETQRLERPLAKRQRDLEMEIERAGTSNASAARRQRPKALLKDDDSELQRLSNVSSH